MVSMLASSVVDRGFEPRSGQTKDYKSGICCFSAKHAALRRKIKEVLLIDKRSSLLRSEHNLCINVVVTLSIHNDL
jgi:hypothetical protein